MPLASQNAPGPTAPVLDRPPLVVNGNAFGSGRLAAFTDGVIAVPITIMVPELKVPAGAALTDPRALWPVSPGDVLRFVHVAIDRINHHHLARPIPSVTGGMLRADLPFATAWVGEHERAPLPTAPCGLAGLGRAAAWLLPRAATIRAQEPESPSRRAVGRDRKDRLSFLPHALGTPSSWRATPLADGCRAAVATLCLLPDRRVDAQLCRRNPS